MSFITLVTGGVRSGKSRFAEQIVSAGGSPLCYIATATAGDAEMKQRIAIHRSRRGEAWHTVEEPVQLSEALAAIDGRYNAILVDCITLWLSNLILASNDSDEKTESFVLGAVANLADTMTGMVTPVVLVTNEVGMGIVPENRLARLFRDIAGRAGQIIAGTADEVYMTVSGIPLRLK